MKVQAHTSARVLTFDLLRIILLFCVLHIHLNILISTPKDFLTPYEYVAVPLFLVLSFYLTAKYFTRNELPFSDVKPRLMRLVIPFVFWSCIGFLVHPRSFVPSEILMQLLTGQVVNLPLYYLVLLILFSILCAVMTYIPRTVRFGAYFGLIAIAFYLQYSLKNYHFFELQADAIRYSYARFVELLPYAMLGTILGVLKSKIERDWRLYLGMPLIAYAGYWYTQDFLLPRGFNYQGLFLFFQTFLAFSLVLIFAKLPIDRYLPRVIHHLGGYTFGIYLFHFVLLEALFLLIPAAKQPILLHPNIFLLFFTGICFYLCFAVDRLTKHKLSHLLR